MTKFKELIRDVKDVRNRLNKIKYEDIDRISSIVYTRLLNLSKALNEKRDRIIRMKNIFNIDGGVANDNIIIKDKEKYHIITYQNVEKIYEAIIFEGDEYTEDFYLPDPPIDANEISKIISLLHLNKGDIKVKSKIANFVLSYFSGH